MKKILLSLAAIALLFACQPENNSGETVEPNLAPSVTVGADKISAISAVLKGKANLTSSASVDLRVGFQYSKSAGILPSNSTTVEAEDADVDYNYSTAITGLEPGTTYYFRSFVRQNGQDTYGETKEFKTKDISSIILTQEVSAISAISAQLNADLDLTDIKYSRVYYGFYVRSEDSSRYLHYESQNLDDNTFTLSFFRLSPKMQYEYKAYVTIELELENGWIWPFDFYGEVKQFTTDVIKVESVSLDRNEYTFRGIGNTLLLKVTVNPDDATDKSVEWSSSNADVATVEQNGKVKAIGNGTATITVTTKNQGKTATCAITVAQVVTGISLDKTLKWTSSDNTVATVDNNGKVTAKSKGTASIRADSQDGSGKYASCSLTVKVPYTAVAPEAVDLGVVVNGKKIKWGSFNLGATKPEEYGDYFAWGEKELKSTYLWSTYKFGTRSSGPFSKYNIKSSYGTVDYKTILDPEDDVAHFALGGSWRMPTDKEWTKLLDKCTWTWTNDYKGTGVRGRIFTSYSTGNSIFLPAAGFRYDTYREDAGSDGLYWSSSLGTIQPYRACCLTFDSGDVYRYSENERCYGHSVRPVTE